MAPINTGSGPLLHSLGCGGHVVVSYFDRFASGVLQFILFERERERERRRL
ncbi:hypothetical protein B296_00038373 [Ensete ventricosum]|uniref:Uncharacterized protein n=1 Tax=Ensete ventricosum TaxID=4639 RepID=A0A426Y003_ENSVE|nr:hypothetical protein B296_00038373 [Ensete ventricosum]